MGYAYGVSPYAPPPGLTAACRVLVSKLISMGAIITATTNGRHAPGSYHYRGMALDMAPSGRLWDYLYPHRLNTLELFGPTFLPGGGLYKYGARFYDSALQAQHQNHIHVAISSAAWVTGGSGGGGGGGFLADLTEAQQKVVLGAATHMTDFIAGLHAAETDGGAPPVSEGSKVSGYRLGHQTRQMLVFLYAMARNFNIDTSKDDWLDTLADKVYAAVT